MATSSDATREKGLGIALAASVVTVGASVGLYLTAGEPISGWAFAAAMVAATVAVVAAHYT